MKKRVEERIEITCFTLIHESNKAMSISSTFFISYLHSFLNSLGQNENE
jgi:hypothetical protein